MDLLSFMTRFESVQFILALGMAAALFALAVGFTYRRGRLAEAELKERIDRVEGHEHVRKIEWYNVQNSPQIDRSAFDRDPE